MTDKSLIDKDAANVVAVSGQRVKCRIIDLHIMKMRWKAIVFAQSHHHDATKLFEKTA